MEYLQNLLRIVLPHSFPISFVCFAAKLHLLHSKLSKSSPQAISDSLFLPSLFSPASLLRRPKSQWGRQRVWIFGVSVGLTPFTETCPLEDHFITVILSEETRVPHTIVYNSKKLKNPNLQIKGH